MKKIYFLAVLFLTVATFLNVNAQNRNNYDLYFGEALSGNKTEELYDVKAFFYADYLFMQDSLWGVGIFSRLDFMDRTDDRLENYQNGKIWNAGIKFRYAWEKSYFDAWFGIGELRIASNPKDLCQDRYSAMVADFGVIYRLYEILGSTEYWLNDLRLGLKINLPPFKEWDGIESDFFIMPEFCPRRIELSSRIAMLDLPLGNFVFRFGGYGWASAYNLKGYNFKENKYEAGCGGFFAFNYRQDQQAEILSLGVGPRSNTFVRPGMILSIYAQLNPDCLVKIFSPSKEPAPEYRVEPTPAKRYKMENGVLVEVIEEEKPKIFPDEYSELDDENEIASKKIKNEQEDKDFQESDSDVLAGLPDESFRPVYGGLKVKEKNGGVEVSWDGLLQAGDRVVKIVQYFAQGTTIMNVPENKTSYPLNVESEFFVLIIRKNDGREGYLNLDFYKSEDDINILGTRVAYNPYYVSGDQYTGPRVVFKMPDNFFQRSDVIDFSNYKVTKLNDDWNKDEMRRKYPNGYWKVNLLDMYEDYNENQSLLFNLCKADGDISRSSVGEMISLIEIGYRDEIRMRIAVGDEYFKQYAPWLYELYNEKYPDKKVVFDKK